MLLSIIIPVYRVEATLRRCVESVLSQSYRGYQLILVDDGSPDRCPRMCDELAREDRRVIVIHQKNQGLSAARNAGIRRAKGEYITFIDSDDTLAPDTLRNLMDILAVHGDYDILEYPYFAHYGNPRKQKINRFMPREYHDMSQYWLEGRAWIHAYACNKIYRRKLFDDVRFPVKRVFEDAYTLPLLLRHCHTVATTDCGLYYYYDNPKGITNTARGGWTSQLLHTQLRNLKDRRLMARYKDFPHDATMMYAYMLNTQMDVYEMTQREPVMKHFGYYFPNIKPTKPTNKVRLAKLLGIKLLCKINTLLHKVYRRSR